jgi:dimeric dUTPase (all-alpha-NTP-PPase superfamily)
MEQALETMLSMQHRMNTRIHQEWISQDYEWYRAIWIECGELLDHYGYKWWKHQSPDLEQVQLEIIDIWHFGMSALFRPGVDTETLALEIARDIQAFEPSGADVRAATEALAEHALSTRGFSVERFWDLMQAAGLGFDELYTSYVGKNVLNFFRQDNGYKEGTYRKLWDGREDNEHLVELTRSLDTGEAGFPDRLYDALSQRYRELG